MRAIQLSSASRRLLSAIMILIRLRLTAVCCPPDSLCKNIRYLSSATFTESESNTLCPPKIPDSISIPELYNRTDRSLSPYLLPYTPESCNKDWNRLWLNTGVLAGAFVSTLFVLECLPEDATAWNRKEIQSVPPLKRWFRNIFKRGPEFDGDKIYFNYILHPYAGAAYYMGARSCGFSAMESMLYSACISTVFWEFGIEAFMERPSIQDIFITPLIGSVIGEGFYKLKHKIVKDGYTLGGSQILGNIVAFLIDPVNEVIGLFAGNDARKQSHMIQYYNNVHSTPIIQTEYGAGIGLSLLVSF